MTLFSPTHSPLYKPTHGDNLGKKKLTKARRNLQRPRFQDYNRRQECNRLVRLKLGSATTTTDPVPHARSLARFDLSSFPPLVHRSYYVVVVLSSLLRDNGRPHHLQLPQPHCNTGCQTNLADVRCGNVFQPAWRMESSKLCPTFARAERLRAGQEDVLRERRQEVVASTDRQREING